MQTWPASVDCWKLECAPASRRLWAGRRRPRGPKRDAVAPLAQRANRFAGDGWRGAAEAVVACAAVPARYGGRLRWSSTHVNRYLRRRHRAAAIGRCAVHVRYRRVMSGVSVSLSAPLRAWRPGGQLDKFKISSRRPPWLAVSHPFLMRVRVLASPCASLCLDAALRRSPTDIHSFLATPLPLPLACPLAHRRTPHIHIKHTRQPCRACRMVAHDAPPPQPPTASTAAMTTAQV